MLKTLIVGHTNKFPDPMTHNNLWFEKPCQHPGRREHVHGAVHGLDCKCGTCRILFGKFARKADTIALAIAAWLFVILVMIDIVRELTKH